MLTRYQLDLVPDRPCRPRAEWGYRLYAALLDRLPAEFGQMVHRDEVSPVSQFVCREGEGLRWTVTLLGEEAQALAGPALEGAEPFPLNKEEVVLTPALRRQDRVSCVEELLLLGGGGNRHRLTFRTPAAFKSQGRYVSLPTPWLVLQSLVKKWNGCFPDCPIEDEDGQGLAAMAAGLTCGDFRLWSRSYWLKGRPIPGFRGELVLENCLSGFHRDLAGALLAFSGFAGVGIKTALGMGGVEHTVR